jgi:hypothetical protein
MNIFKNLRKPYLALISGAFFLLFSCSQEHTFENNSEFFEDPKIALKKFELSLNEIEPLLEKFNVEKSKLNKTSNKNNTLINQILNELSEPSLELLTDYGFNDKDFKEVFGNSNKEELKKEIAGAGLILYRLQTLNNNDKNLVAKGNARPDAVECFLEATGISAGIGLVGALTAQAGGKAVKKALKVALKKIGSRMLGGVGLILMAAEFTWCMNG